jgi:hypothetical protein
MAKIMTNSTMMISWKDQKINSISEFQISGVGIVETLHHKNAKMSECRNAKNTSWCKFWILRVGSVETLHHKNSEMSECRNAKYQELEVSKHFTTGMSKCQNAEMRKTPFGAGFRYWELECRNTSPQECRNARMLKFKKQLLVQVLDTRSWRSQELRLFIKGVLKL